MRSLPRSVIHATLVFAAVCVVDRAGADPTPPAGKPAILTRQLALTLTAQKLNGRAYTAPSPMVIPVNVVAVGSRFTFVGRGAPKVLGITSPDGSLRAGFADGSLVLEGKGSFGSRVEGTFRLAPSAGEVYVGSFEIEGARFEAGVGVNGGLRGPSTASWGNAGLTSGWNSGGPTNWNSNDGLFSGHEKAKPGGSVSGWASEDDPNSASGGGGSGGGGGQAADAAAAKWRAATDKLGCPPGATCTGTGKDDFKNPKPEEKSWFTKQADAFKKWIGWAKTPVDDGGRGGGGTGTLNPAGGGVRPGGGDPNPNGTSGGTGGRSGASGSYVSFRPVGGDDPFEKTVADALNINRLHDPSADPMFAKIAAFRANAN